MSTCHSHGEPLSTSWTSTIVGYQSTHCSDDHTSHMVSLGSFQCTKSVVFPLERVLCLGSRSTLLDHIAQNTLLLHGPSAYRYFCFRLLISSRSPVLALLALFPSCSSFADCLLSSSCLRFSTWWFTVSVVGLVLTGLLVNLLQLLRLLDVAAL